MVTPGLAVQLHSRAAFVLLAKSGLRLVHSRWTIACKVTSPAGRSLEDNSKRRMLG
jgi:hypothetical protein